MEYRYVDTAADASGDGSTRDHSSGDSSHAFDSLFAAEAWMDIDRASLSDDLTIKCAGSAADTAAVHWDAFGGNANTLKVMGDDGADDSGDGGDDASAFNDDGRYTGPLDWSTSHYRLEVADEHSFKFGVNVQSITVQDMQILQSGTTSSRHAIYSFYTDTASSSDLILIQNNRIWCTSTDTNIGIFLQSSTDAETIRVQNNIVVHNNRAMILRTSTNTSTATYHVYNNTCKGVVGDETRGIEMQTLGTSAAIYYVANNVSFNQDDDVAVFNAGSGTWVFSQNASNDAVVANSIDIVTEADEFVDPTGSSPGDFNFAPKLSTSQLIGAGDLTYSPSRDINGVLRKTSGGDVGAIESGVTLSGTAVPRTTPDVLKAGGLTLIFSLVGDTWDATLGAANSVTDDFIAGLTSNRSDALGWNNQYRDSLISATHVTRDSDTQVTVVIPVSVLYTIPVTETITPTIPATALTTSASSVVAINTFSVTVASGGSQITRLRVMGKI